MTKHFMNDIVSKEIGKETESNSKVKALSHGAIFLATCNAILLLRDVNL